MFYLYAQVNKILKPNYKKKILKRVPLFITKSNMPNIQKLVIVDGESVALGYVRLLQFVRKKLFGKYVFILQAWARLHILRKRP